MACEDTRQLTEAQRVAGYQSGRTGVPLAVRPFSGRPTIENLIDYINRELQPAVRRSRDAVNDIYLQTTDNAPSGNPLGYYFSTETGNADPTAGRIRLNQATQDTATILRVSESNGRLIDVAPWLDVMAGSVTSPLGVVTLTDAINPGRFIRFDLTAMADAGAYWNLTVAPIESSHDNPFIDGGAVVISFIPGVGGATAATIPPTAISGSDGPRQFLSTSTGTTVDWRTLNENFPGAPIYDVMAYPFNATGDGVADDRTAINTAIAAALVTPGIVYLGRAHRITGALTAINTNCVILQGRGMDTNGTTLTCTTSPSAIISFTSGARFGGVRDIRIVGASGTTGYAVLLQQAFRCFAHNLRISAVGNGIEIDRCNTTFIENVDVIDPLDDYGFHVHGVNPDFCHVTRFVRCQVGGSGTTYIGFAHGSFAHTVIYMHCGVLQGDKGMYVFDDQGDAPTFIHAWQFSSDHPTTTGVHLEACDGAVMFDQVLATSILTPGNPSITIGANATRWQFSGGEANQGLTIAGTAGVVRGMHTSTIALASTAAQILVENNHLTGALTVASGADNYVVTGNYVGGGITNTPGRADTRVVFDNVPDTEVAVGSVWGLAIDHGASDVPREITKFERGESIRRETVVVDSTSSGTSNTYAIASTTTHVQFKLAGALTINGMTASSVTFGKLVVFSFDSGFAGSVTWNNESGSAGSSLERCRLPGSTALTISAGEIAVFEYFDSRWRCIALGKANAITDGDKGDITVSSSGAVWNIDAGVVTETELATSVAGAGLTGGGGTALAVGAGTGITVNANDVAVTIPLTDGDKGDITVSSSGATWTVDVNIAKTWTGVHSFTGASHTENVSGAVSVTAGTDVSIAATDDVLVNASSGLALVAGSGATGFPITTVTPGDIQILADDGIAIDAEGAAGVSITTTAFSVDASGDLLLDGAGGVGLFSGLAAAAVADGDVLINASSGVGIFAGFASAEVAVSDDDVSIGADSGLALTAGVTAVTNVAAGVLINSGTDVTLTATGEVVAGSTVRLDAAIRFAGVAANSTNGQINDLAIGEVNVVRFTAVDLLTGMVASASGQLVWLVNATGADFPIGIEHAGSTAANRFAGTGTTRVLRADEMVPSWYDGTSSRWRLTGDDIGAS